LFEGLEAGAAFFIEPPLGVIPFFEGELVKDEY
jgi:hypothetical protein